MRMIPSIVVKLGVLSLLNDISSEMVFPLLPLLLMTLPGGGPVAIGIIEGIAETTGTFLKLGSGIWADRIRRRTPFVTAGYALAGITRPLIAIVTAWPMVLGLRFLDRVGKGLRGAPRDAMIADAAPPERRGAAFGFQRMMDHTGAVGGPLIAMLLMGGFGLSVRSVILLAGAPALVLIAVALTLRETPYRTVPRTELPVSSAGPRNRDFRRFLGAIFVFTLGNSTDAFLILRLSESGVSAATIAFLWSLHHLVKIAGAWLGGAVTDHMGSKPAMFAGLGMYSLVYLAFGTLASTAALIGVFVIYGAALGMIEPAEGAWTAALSFREKRGAAYGYIGAAKGFAALPASVGFGLVWKSFGAFPAFLAGAVLAAMAAVMLLGVRQTFGTPPEVRETDGAVVDR